MRAYASSKTEAFLLSLLLLLGTRTLNEDNRGLPSMAVEAFSIHRDSLANPMIIMSNAAGQRLFMATGGGEESVMGIPTLEQLSSDPFMKQVHHAEFVCGLLLEDDGRKTDVVMKRLRAQLSHKDGVRGFLVTYLTCKQFAKAMDVPPALLKALLEVIDPVNDSNSLISLMCLNIIMPTAMVRTHKDPQLKMESALTAARAMSLMTVVMDASGRDSAPREAVTKQCKAILDMAKSKDFNAEGDMEAQKYWAEIFGNWGYDDVQRSDIAHAVRSVLAK